MVPLGLLHLRAENVKVRLGCVELIPLQQGVLLVFRVHIFLLIRVNEVKTAYPHQFLLVRQRRLYTLEPVFLHNTLEVRKGHFCHLLGQSKNSFRLVSP